MQQISLSLQYQRCYIEVIYVEKLGIGYQQFLRRHDQSTDIPTLNKDRNYGKKVFEYKIESEFGWWSLTVGYFEPRRIVFVILPQLNL